MTNVVQNIPLANLAVSAIPVAAVTLVLFKWSLGAGNAVYALARMLLQLLLIGYFLTYIFESKNALVICAILTVMVFVSSWIALGTVKARRPLLYRHALLAIFTGGGLTLFLVTAGVLRLQPWYLPQLVIPLAGMIFANSMNSISIAVERFNAELEHDISYEQARNKALNAAMIPVINSLFAVGLVSLPGMMTGQILSGVSPLIAVRYQIMVMCMIFGSSGLSTICFLITVRGIFIKNRQQ